MNTQNNTQKKQFSTIIGIDLGDTKHAICVTDKDGTILKEYSIVNTRQKLETLVEDYPESLIAMEALHTTDCEWKPDSVVHTLTSNKH